VDENDAGEVLLIEHSDNGTWSLSGGAMDLGESIAEAAVREIFSVVFSARPLRGEPAPNTESSTVLWAAPADLELHRMHGSMRQRKSRYLERRSAPYIG
jgi:NUDIX domain